MKLESQTLTDEAYAHVLQRLVDLRGAAETPLGMD